MSRKSIVETPFMAAASADLERRALSIIRPKAREDAVEWVESSIDLSFDHTTSVSGLVRLYPYQREVLRAIDDPDCREVTIEAGQRLGKSSLWKYGLLKRVHDKGCSGLIVYPKMTLAESTNRDTVVPLLQTLPEARADLEVRGNMMRTSYHMPSLGSVIYFLGGQTQVISMTANFCVLDEADFVELENDEAEKANMSQLRAVRLRMQSFKHRMMVVCSSPTGVGGTVHKNWLEGSRGMWHLRCLGCGRLYPSSRLAWLVGDGKWAGLQWQKDANSRVIEDSIRWICPDCGREHEYAEAAEMNELGEYVHAFPEVTRHRSFQVGAMANPALWSWNEIAREQEAATDADGRKFLCNTILGLPYQHVKEGDPAVGIEEANRNRMRSYPDGLESRLSCVFMAVDQQKSEMAGRKYYVYVARGWDEAGNSWLLGHGTANSLEELRERLHGEYFGQRIGLCLIDHGGFDNTEDLDPFVRSEPLAYYYKGTSGKLLQGQRWKRSQEVPKLFLCDALHYQCELLDRLYGPKRSYEMWIPGDVSDQYFKELCAVRPNTRMSKDSNGLQYPNWCAVNERRDFFDAEKMALVALDLAGSSFGPRNWRFGHVPAFMARQRLAEMARRRKVR